MSGLLSLKWNNHSTAFLNLINNLHSKELYCDATIACHGKYYPVHRLILTTCSEYFQEIFNMTQCKHPFIIVNDVQPRDLEALLSYMYKGDVNVLQDSLPSLIKAAEALKIKGLAVPDELPSENESSNSRKRSSSHGHSSSKRSRISERSEFEGSASHSEVNHLPAESSYHGTNTIPVTSKDVEVKKEVMEDDPVDSTPDFDHLEHPFSSNEEIPSAVKTEPFDCISSSFPSQGPDRSDVDAVPLSEAVVWPNSLNGSETSSQPPAVDWASSLDGSESSSQPPVPVTPADLATSALDNIPPNLKSSEKLFTCEYCSYMCPQKGNLKRHIRRIHTGEKPFACTICPYRCVSGHILKTHVRKHTGEKPFQCPFCFLRYSDRSNFVKHLKYVHQSKKT